MGSETLSCCALAAGGIFKLSDEKEHKVSGEIDFDGGRVVRFHLGVLSSYSYLLCSCNAAMLIDPGRDVGNYEKYLQDHNIRLCGVFLTHLHTDFVAGHMEAGERFNVPVFIGRESGAEFPHITIDDEANFSLGRLRLHFFASPGHAEDGVCMSAGVVPGVPELLFTGDALEAPASAVVQMDWLKHLESLPDEIRICPGHGKISEDPEILTLAVERERNPLFNPSAPVRESHGRSDRNGESLRRINRTGPELVNWDNTFEEIAPIPSLAEPGSHVIDIRSHGVYAGGHVPHSINIESNGRLEYWAARLFDPLERTLVLVGENFFELAEASARLKSVGFECEGFNFDLWRKAGFAIRNSAVVTVEELDTWLWSDEPPLAVDVRTAAEWQKGHLSGSVNIPLAELAEKMHTLPEDRDIITVCASGFRSAAAVGILEEGKFRSISNLLGGLGAWIESGKLLDSGKGKDHTPDPSKCGMKS